MNIFPLLLLILIAPTIHADLFNWGKAEKLEPTLGADVKNTTKPNGRPFPNNTKDSPVNLDDRHIKPKPLDDPILLKKTFLNEEIELAEGEDRPMQISLRGLMSEVSEGAKDDNVIIIEITGSNGKNMSFSDVEVISRMLVPEKEFVKIRPKIIRDDDDNNLVYFYILYDLCKVDKEKSQI